MGLDPGDPTPTGISYFDAYTAIRKWYQANVQQVESKSDKYSARSASLIKALPGDGSLSELEVRAVLGEVIHGSLEWAYHKSDGRYKMAAYAHAAFKAVGAKYSFGEDELKKLRTSKLWPFLSINREGENA